jgi:hypothetical protein
MSVTYQLRLIRDDMSPSIKKVLTETKPEKVTSVMAKEGKKLTQRHLLAKGTNKRGWPTTNFWARAAKATSAVSNQAAAIVRITQIGVAQRYYGGPIVPRPPRKMLTIPIGPEAYGKTASDFPESYILRTKKGAYIVQKGETLEHVHSAPRIRRRKSETLDDWMDREETALREAQSKSLYTTTRVTKSGPGYAPKRVVAAIEFLFKLSPGVKQRADPTVLPDERTISQGVLNAIDLLVKEAAA